MFIPKFKWVKISFYIHFYHPVFLLTCPPETLLGILAVVESISASPLVVPIILKQTGPTVFVPPKPWRLIVSGGDQSELRDVFKQRELDKFFDGGIFGSPDTKDMILSREIQISNIIKPSLFIGDSKYDYQAAKNAGLEFLFISQWSEVVDWAEWCTNESINWKHNIMDLID